MRRPDLPVEQDFQVLFYGLRYGRGTHLYLPPFQKSL